MEALFIGLLCYCQGGLESPFRFYYLLSLICCAMRHDVAVTAATCALHCASAGALYLATPPDARQPFELITLLLLLGWVAWAASSLALLLKRYGEHVSRLNAALREHQTQLETRIAERTRELNEIQAQLLHNEKMAAFGLLAAGIAHEVGNPLTGISSIVQMLRRRELDDYTRSRLELVGDQLQRIQGIVRELVTFSRPASNQSERLAIADVIAEALSIAKYYKGSKSRIITVDAPAELPVTRGVRGQLVSVFLNLVVNAVDATDKGGRIDIGAHADDDLLVVTVVDDGHGMTADQQSRLFQPYFTTKPRGTGLGLFMARQLLARHEGTIECESTAGAGTRFTIRLPIAQPSVRVRAIAAATG